MRHLQSFVFTTAVTPLQFAESVVDTRYCKTKRFVTVSVKDTARDEHSKPRSPLFLSAKSGTRFGDDADTRAQKNLRPLHVDRTEGEADSRLFDTHCTGSLHKSSAETHLLNFGCAQSRAQEGKTRKREKG